MSVPIASSSRLAQGNGQPIGSYPSGTTAPARNGRPGRPDPTPTERASAGSSKTSTSSAARPPRPNDPVRAAQDEATRVWRADMRKLLDRAEERFADVCWTSATPDTHDQSDLDSDLDHAIAAGSENTHHSNTHSALIPASQASIPNPTASSASLIWAHKAIFYARAPNTFQTRFLNLRSPAAQLQHIGSTPSLVSLPLHRSESQLSLNSNFSSSTQTGAPPSKAHPASNANSLSARTGIPAKPRKSVRGAAPPSSFSMTKPSLRKPISRSSISRPLRRGSVDDTGSIGSGFMTSDSEGEGGPVASLRASRLINARPAPSSVEPTSLTSSSKVSHASCTSNDPGGPARKPSFASVTSAAESRLTDTRSIISDASTLRAPISLGGVSQAFFEATLQYLYTGEEAMVDAFEFLFEDRLASDSEASPEEKLDKLRSDLTFMWRSKLYSDVKLVLGEGDDHSDDTDGAGPGGRGQPRRNTNKMVDIPDANMSVLSLAQTIDTERIERSDTEDDEMTSFSTHRMILASRSQYFASLLLSPYSDSKAPVLHLPSPPFTPASLHFTLGFLYTGTLFFSNRTFDLSTAFSLWRAGAYLQIETLQALVAALIDREFCHGFACSPPCRKCVKRVPRTLAFATSPDVSEQALQEPAMAAVSGAHFGMYWAKDVGNLDPMLQDRICDAISDRLSSDPTLVVSVLRQLSIVGQRIDTERSSRWVESLRLMAETAENRLMPILHNNLDKIVSSPAWSDLLDGVGSLGDVLEKCLVMLIDGLTEARAAQMYQTLVGRVLLREQGFEVAQSRQAVENARSSILRYLKKRWINIRALAGFNKLEKWCLKEIADELEVTTTDLLMPEELPKLATPPSRLLAGRKTPSVSGTVPAAGTAGRGVGHRSSLRGAMASSRVRTVSTASNSSANNVASQARRPIVRDEGEREAGPIHMRAAVLNRNAARTSVANGHRSLSSASNGSTSSPTRRPAVAVHNASKGAGSASPPTIATRTTTPIKSSTPSTANTEEGSPSRAVTPNAQRARTPSGTSVAGLTRSVNGKPATASSTAKSSTEASPKTFPTSTAITNAKAITPKRSTTALPVRAEDLDKTPTKTIRPVRSTSTLPPRSPSTVPAKPSYSVDSAVKPPVASQKPKVLAHKSSFLRATPGPGGTFSLSSTDSGVGLRARTVSGGSGSTSGAGPKKSVAASGDRTGANVGMVAGAGAAGRRSTTPTAGVKTAVRKLSTGSSTSGSGGRSPIASTRKLSSGSLGSGKSVSPAAEAMPVDALINVRRAQLQSQSPNQRGEEGVIRKEALPKRSQSNNTIVYHPDADSPSSSPSKANTYPGGEGEVEEAGTGIRLIVGIPCIVSLRLAPISSSASSLSASPGGGVGGAFAAKRPTSSATGSGLQSKKTIQTGKLSSVSARPSSTINVSKTGAGAGGRGNGSVGGGGGKKLRAQVRYLGPVRGAQGVWVGIQLRLASHHLNALVSGSGSTITGSILQLENGSFNGVQYLPSNSPPSSFQSSNNHDGEEGAGEDRVGENEERRQKRLQLWNRFSPPNASFPNPRSTASSSSSSHIARHTQTAAAQSEDQHPDSQMVDLFVRPNDIVWVIQE